MIAREIWQHGSLFTEGPRLERFVETPHGLTTYFGIGQSFAFIPFDVLGFFLGKYPGLSGEMSGFVQTLPLLFLYAPLVGILWWWGLVGLLSAAGFSQRLSLGVGTLFILTTSALPYISQSLQEEAILGALVTFAYWAVFRNRFHIGGLLAGSCLLFRLNSAFALLPLFGLLADRKKLNVRSVLRLGTGAIAPLLVLAVTNAIRFGSPFSTGYDLAYQQLSAQGITTWQTLRPDVAFDLLFGFGKGVFVLAPPLLFSLYGLFLGRKANRWFFVSLVLSFLGSAFLYSKLWGYACGGYAWGSRFHIHLTTLLTLPLAWAVRTLWQKGTGRRAVLFAATLGLAFQGLAGFAPESLEYLQEQVRLGDYREELITGGVTRGHLPIRTANFAHWLGNSPLPQEARAPGLLGGYRRNYLPNFWGPNYSRVSGSPLPLFLWRFFLLSAVGFLTFGALSLFEISPRHWRFHSLKQLLIKRVTPM